MKQIVLTSSRTATCCRP